MLIAVLVVAVAALVIYFAAIRPKQKKQREAARPEKEVQGLVVKGVPNKFPFEYVTPSGLPIGSTVEFSSFFQPFIFRALEYGIRNQIAATRAKFPHWTKARNLNEYCVLFIEPQATNEDGSPALLVGGWQTAGTVIGMGGEYPIFAIVLPHQGKQFWKHLVYLLFSAWNESEHFAEFANDREEAEKYLNGYDQHQHHPLNEGVLMVTEIEPVRGFRAQTAPLFVFCHCIAPAMRGLKAPDLSAIEVPAGVKQSF